MSAMWQRGKEGSPQGEREPIPFADLKLLGLPWYVFLLISVVAGMTIVLICNLLDRIVKRCRKQEQVPTESIRQPTVEEHLRQGTVPELNSPVDTMPYSMNKQSLADSPRRVWEPPSPQYIPTPFIGHGYSYNY
jgi:hypothetical protein